MFCAFGPKMSGLPGLASLTQVHRSAGHTSRVIAADEARQEVEVMPTRSRLVALSAAVWLVLSCLTLSGCASEKCGPSLKVLAAWPGHSTSVYACGGFPPMVGPPAGSAGAAPEIVLQVGQQVRLSESGDWSGHHVSAPVSDDPTVMRVAEASAGKVVGVFVAVAPGYANLGARTDACGTGVCAFIEVQVASASPATASPPPVSSGS